MQSGFTVFLSKFSFFVNKNIVIIIEIIVRNNLKQITVQDEWLIRYRYDWKITQPKNKLNEQIPTINEREKNKVINRIRKPI